MAVTDDTGVRAPSDGGPTFDRTPPQDIAAEQSVLGGMLLSKDAIAEVVETGEPVRLSPMNPFERKIVHDVVAGAGLVSESEGEEPNRRVVVLPA